MFVCFQRHRYRQAPLSKREGKCRHCAGDMPIYYILQSYWHEINNMQIVLNWQSRLLIQ